MDFFLHSFDLHFCHEWAKNAQLKRRENLFQCLAFHFNWEIYVEINLQLASGFNHHFFLRFCIHSKFNFYSRYFIVDSAIHLHSEKWLFLFLQPDCMKNWRNGQRDGEKSRRQSMYGSIECALWHTIMNLSASQNTWNEKEKKPTAIGKH